MYNLPYFKAKDDKEVLAFMKANPFITLCGIDTNNKPVATHIPVLFEEREGKLFLQAHIMRKQNHTNAFEQNSNVLALFVSNHTYVSASLYEQKNIASTLNYMAVHVSGIIKFLGDEELYNLLVKLTDTFEGNSNSVAAIKNMDAAYVQNNMKAIVAFEIEVTDIQHVFKLSQNHSKKDYENIVDSLQSKDANGKFIATEMEKIKDDLFAN